MAQDQKWSDEFMHETRQRIEEMEARDHVFPKAFSGTDWALAILTIVVTGALLVAGAGM